MASHLHEKVTRAVTEHNLQIDELECDPEFADTAAFNKKYGFLPEQGANTDKAVLSQPKVIMGGGNRTSKIAIQPSELLKLPQAKVVEGLADPIQ